ncbi:multicopper oxidase family protein [Corynebacterium sp. A21]|uniref:multicopper oxidase family protein n=1 Tax=Corynebacterium sp. A21 TaxID=3457318 RepID=UPI003FD660FD
MPEPEPAVRALARIARRVLGVLLIAACSWTGWLWWDSIQPAQYSAVPPEHAAHGAARVTGAVGITELVADPTRPADVRLVLAARTAVLNNSNGGSFTGYTLNGSTPGPEIRARAGDLIEVVLRNLDVEGGTTLHWHGIEVPGAMDGVAGITQDAVKPGESFTYRFIAEDPGTFWYHSHQVSHQQVLGGLFGALVIAPHADSPPIPDTTMLLHTYPGGSRTIGGTTGESRREAAPGTTLRVRSINSDNLSTYLWVSGSAARLLALDGRELNGPELVGEQKIRLAAGARVDLEVTVPEEGAVRVQAPGVSLVLGPAAATAAQLPAPARELDLLNYGIPVEPPFSTGSPDRSFEYTIDRRIGFLDGRPGYWWTINGKMGRHVPMYLVSEGEVVKMRVTNDSAEVHPMHLHGHHALVHSRNSQLTTGSPWWTDSLDVDPGESYEIFFEADNPGIWMDHCHNLPHAVDGLMTHLSYEGVTTPFLLGPASGNEPE